MNELAVRNNNVIQTFDDVERAAKAMSASGFFPDSKQAAQAIVKVLAGRELGFGAFASMTGVSVIQGKPVIGANLLAAAVKQTGKYNYRVTKHNEQECQIAFFEKDQQVGVSTFTMDDAKAANLTGKDNWKKYPRNMLFARAISNGQKWYAPDVFNGVTVYTPDELDATVDDDGNIIEAETKPSEPLQIESTTPAPVKKQEHEGKRKHAELWKQVNAKGLLNKDTVSLWSIKASDTDEVIDGKITLLENALSEKEGQ